MTSGTAARRGSSVALLLMHAALRYAEASGARTIVAIGKLETLPMYRRAGLRELGPRARSGKVTYALMSADVRDLLERCAAFRGALSRLARRVDWRVAFAPSPAPNAR